MQNENPKIEVRDLRDGDWLWTNKAVLFSQYVTDSAYRLYSGFASYAGNVDQKSWPSLQTLATKLNMSKNTIIRGSRLLEACGLIRIDRKVGFSNVYYLLNCKEIKAPGPVLKKEESPHHRLIKFFDQVTKDIRGIKIVWRVKDFEHLKRVLNLDILTEKQIEQLMLYFLAHPPLKKYSPSLATFLSPGILNGLMNAMKNDRNFWKDLDVYQGRIGSATPERESIPIAKLSDMISALSATMKTPSHDY